MMLSTSDGEFEETEKKVSQSGRKRRRGRNALLGEATVTFQSTVDDRRLHDAARPLLRVVLREPSECALVAMKRQLSNKLAVVRDNSVAVVGVDTSAPGVVRLAGL